MALFNDIFFSAKFSIMGLPHCKMIIRSDWFTAGKITYVLCHCGFGSVPHPIDDEDQRDQPREDVLEGLRCCHLNGRVPQKCPEPLQRVLTHSALKL